MEEPCSCNRPTERKRNRMVDINQYPIHPATKPNPKCNDKRLIQVPIPNSYHCNYLTPIRTYINLFVNSQNHRPIIKYYNAIFEYRFHRKTSWGIGTRVFKPRQTLSASIDSTCGQHFMLYIPFS